MKNQVLILMFLAMIFLVSVVAERHQKEDEFEDNHDKFNENGENKDFEQDQENFEKDMEDVDADDIYDALNEELPKNDAWWSRRRRSARRRSSRRRYSPPRCATSVYYNGKCMRQVPTRAVVENTLHFGAYIGGSHTCDNLRAKSSDTTWTDQENGKWIVKWGVTKNVCFPAGGQVYFRSGHISERQGHDQQTRYLCCDFSRQRGGWNRDDFTRVCCLGLAKGTGIKHTDTNYFKKVIDLMNAGAPYAQAAAQVAAAVAKARGDEME